ncbi:ABA4-like family protein [Dactylosporangium darangshiense]|uniref:ABA4-like family protein n=1 Tax=Dactylosporangium darangshiense TaxID=579108 RepID=UPI003637B76D
MTATLFTLTFALAAPFWALMILLPRWSWTARIIGSPLIVLPVLAIYAILVLAAAGDVLPAVLSPTLSGVRDLLGTADGAAAAWAHMIAFDLFVGRWAWLDSRERGCPRWSWLRSWC